MNADLQRNIGTGWDDLGCSRSPLTIKANSIKETVW
jgi:hypothetical protein